MMCIVSVLNAEVAQNTGKAKYNGAPGCLGDMEYPSLLNKKRVPGNFSKTRCKFMSCKNILA